MPDNDKPLSADEYLKRIEAEIAECEARKAEHREEIAKRYEYIKNCDARIRELKLMRPRKPRARKAKAADA